MLPVQIIKLRLVLLTSIFIGLNSVIFCQADTSICNYKDSVYWMRYEAYNPYSWINVASLPLRVTRSCTNGIEVIEYSYEGVTGSKTNRIILTFNKYNPSLSKYKSKIVYPGFRFPETPEYSTKLEFVDSLVFSYQKKNHTIKKYKAEVLKGEYVTLYYNDSIGIIKQYGSYRSISEDNIELEYIRLKDPQKDLVKAFLIAISNNATFHERYDFGPRIINKKVIDKKLFRKTKRLYKRKGYI